MQKALRFLEATVEWFALGLAGIYLLWTGFYYLVGQQVVESLDGKQVTPMNIDQTIRDGPAAMLQKIIDRDKDDPSRIPSFDVADFASAVTQGLAMETEDTPPLAQVFEWNPFDLGSQESIKVAGQAVKQLPVLPPAQAVMVATGLDTFASAPGGPPVAPPLAGPAAAPAQPVALRDVDLTVAAFRIPWQPLLDQWNKSFGPDKPKGPPKLANVDVQIISVVAYRSEKLPNGNWGPESPVHCLQGDLPPYPPKGDKTAEVAYLTAWSKDPTVVASPPMPTPVAGAIWPKNPLDLLARTVPTAGQPGGINGVLVPRAAAPSSDSFWVTVQRAGRGPAGGGGSPGGGYGPTGPYPRTPPRQPITPPTPPTAAPAVETAPGTAKPIVNAVVNAGAAPAALPAVFPGKLNVLNLPANSPDLCVYVIDDSTRSGQTYRYRIVYKLANPLFNQAPSAALDPAWVDQFDLVSPISNYSPEISVPIKTYLYCGKQQAPGRKTFPFEVVTWAAGKWQKDTFAVSPGDPIGALDNGIDYSTGYTYADGHPTISGKFLVTLMNNENGAAEIRDAGRDTTSEDYKLKMQWIAQQQSTPTGTGGATAAPPTPTPSPAYAIPPATPSYRGGRAMRQPPG